MISKIISGGGNTIEKAVIEKAVELGVRCGGWMPRTGHADREFAEKFGIREVPAGSPLTDIEQNILDSDGVLLFSHGGPDDGFAGLVRTNGVPFLHMDLKETIAFNAVKTISPWITENRIEQLYVTGRTPDEGPDLYEKVSGILEAVIYFSMMANVQGGFAATPSHFNPTARNDLPENVREAVDRLVSKMALKDKTTIANMVFDELSSLMPTVGEYIREQFGLAGENGELVESCRFVAGKADLDADDAIMTIIAELWEELRETHKLRVVK